MARFCPSCGQEITEEGTFCINCGYNLNQNNYNNQNSFNYNTSGENFNQSISNEYNNAMAITGFVLGILSILCCCFFTGLSVAGLIFSIIGLSNADSHNGKGKGLAITGIVLNGIGIFFLIIYSVMLLFL